MPFNKTTCIPCKNYIPLAGINRDTLKDNLKDPEKKDMYMSGLGAYEKVFNLANMHDAFAPGQLNFGGDDITISSRSSSAVDPNEVSDELDLGGVRGGQLLPLRDVVIISSSSSSAAGSAVDPDEYYYDTCTECGWIGPAIDVGLGMCVQCMP